MVQLQERIRNKQDSQGQILALAQSGLGFQIKARKTFQVVPSSLWADIRPFRGEIARPQTPLLGLHPKRILAAGQGLIRIWNFNPGGPVPNPSLVQTLQNAASGFESDLKPTPAAAGICPAFDINCPVFDINYPAFDINRHPSGI